MGFSRGVVDRVRRGCPAPIKFPRVAPQLPLQSARLQMPAISIAKNAPETSANARTTHRFDFRGDEADYRINLNKSNWLREWWPGADLNCLHGISQFGQIRLPRKLPWLFRAVFSSRRPPPAHSRMLCSDLARQNQSSVES